jgi:hypothetical protein
MDLYERNQQHNRLNAWLHSLRFKNTLSILRRMSVAQHGRPLRVIEIGSAHGKLFGLLKNEQFAVDYTGIELLPLYAQVSVERYGGYPNFRVVFGSAADVLPDLQDTEPDVVIALETMEHIPDVDVDRTLSAIAALRPRRFLCSVPVEVGPILWIKNIGSALTGYTRHEEYSWMETLWAGAYQLDRLPPHGIKHKGFDWRQLERAIAKRMNVQKIQRFPFGMMAGLSTSVYIVAQPYLHTYDPRQADLQPE